MNITVKIIGAIVIVIIVVFVRLRYVQEMHKIKNKDIHEFSTSMDFDEFETVIKHLKNIDPTFGAEVSQNINTFKNSSKIGDVQRFNLKKNVGHMTLEREDPQCFSIFIFTTKEMEAKITQAFHLASEELGI